MYESLGHWKTSIFFPDFESCTLSYCFPCHIYAMANKPNYMCSFLFYALTIVLIQRFWYQLYYLHTYACPSTKVDYCLGTECKNQYMIVNGVTTPCVYHTDIGVCTYSSISCIENPYYTNITISLSFLYVSIFVMNYFIRQKIKREKQIQTRECGECFVPCGLAQMYREIV